MDVDILDHDAVDLLRVSALHTRLSRPGARWARCSSLLATSQPRRRAFPAHPMTAHSGVSNCGF